MNIKSQWFKGFLDAEQEVKSGVSSISLEIDHVTFHYPEGGSSGYAGYAGQDGQYLRGMKDYVRQYQQVIKSVLEGQE